MKERSYLGKLFGDWKAPKDNQEKSGKVLSEQEMQKMVDYLYKDAKEQTIDELHSTLLKLLVKTKNNPELAKKFDLPKLQKEAAEKYARAAVNDILDPEKSVGNNVDNFLVMTDDLIREAGVKLSDVVTPEEMTALMEKQTESHIKWAFPNKPLP